MSTEIPNIDLRVSQFAPDREQAMRENVIVGNVIVGNVIGRPASACIRLRDGSHKENVIVGNACCHQDSVGIRLH